MSDTYKNVIKVFLEPEFQHIDCAKTISKLETTFSEIRRQKHFQKNQFIQILSRKKDKNYF